MNIGNAVPPLYEYIGIVSTICEDLWRIWGRYLSHKTNVCVLYYSWPLVSINCNSLEIHHALRYVSKRFYDYFLSLINNFSEYLTYICVSLSIRFLKKIYGLCLMAFQTQSTWKTIKVFFKGAFIAVWIINFWLFQRK